MRLILFLFFLFLVCWGGVGFAENVFDDVVFHVDFGGLNVDDEAGDMSIGTARGIEFVRIAKLPNGNGIGACFKGNSVIDYGLGAKNELKIEGAFTYRIRVKFSDTKGERFIMGRFGNAPVSFLTLFRGFPHGHISLGKNHFGGASSGAYCRVGKFYDIFFRFQPKGKKVKGFLKTSVYESGTGTLVGESIKWPSEYAKIRDAKTPFTVGGAGDYDGLCGIVEQINVWRRAISGQEMRDVVTKEFYVKVADKRTKEILKGVGGECKCIGRKKHERIYDERASRRWHDWVDRRKEFPTIAWGYFQRYKGTVGEYEMYKGAGLSIVIAPLGTEPNAAKVGLETLIGHWGENDKYLKLHYHSDRLREFVEYGKEHVSVTGYLLSDEAKSVDEFRKLGKAFEYIYEHDKRSLPINTLMSYPFSIGGGFEKYIEEYMRIVKPAVLLTTGYVLYKEGITNENRFYAIHEVLREKALEADIGHMGFVLNVRHGPYRQASESDLYWQVNSLLAYGVKGIWYYNYRITSKAYGEGLVRGLDGKPTQIYYYVREINRRLNKIWPVFKKLKSVGVFHTGGRVPTGARKYERGCVEGIKELKGDRFIVGQFSNVCDEDDKSVYVMFVNKRFGAGKGADDVSVRGELEFSVVDDYPLISKYDADKGKWVKLRAKKGKYVLKFRGGEGILVRFEKKI